MSPIQQRFRVPSVDSQLAETSDAANGCREPSRELVIVDEPEEGREEEGKEGSGEEGR